MNSYLNPLKGDLWNPPSLRPSGHLALYRMHPVQQIANKGEDFKEWLIWVINFMNMSTLSHPNEMGPSTSGRMYEGFAVIDKDIRHEATICPFRDHNEVPMSAR